jgi:aminoglycoside phosphotransferase family enzyme
MDIAEELSFLEMECEMMGDQLTGRHFVDIYRTITHDNIPEPLINFYKRKKAALRAYLSARHIAEPHYKEDPRWLIRANAYLKRAESYPL